VRLHLLVAAGEQERRDWGERMDLGVRKRKGAVFFGEVGMTLVSSCHCGMATSDADAGVAGFAPLVYGGRRSGTQIVVFLVRGPRWECPKSLRAQRAFYSLEAVDEFNSRRLHFDTL